MRRVEVSGGRGRPLIAIAVATALILLGLPAMVGRGTLQDLFFIFTMLALAQYWNLLAGYAGLVSVGQQAYVGLGGYALFAAAIAAGLNPLFGIALAGCASGLLALALAPVVFRLRGAYFAIGTWVIAEICRLVFAQVKSLGGGTGTSLPPEAVKSIPGLALIGSLFGVGNAAARDILAYWLAALLLGMSLAGIYWLLRSPRGLALSALRDSETAAESIGIDTARCKLLVYVLTAAGTGFTGALIHLQNARISPDAAFSVVDWTAYVIFIVAIGGIGTIEGPIIGVVMLLLLRESLSELGSWYLIILGSIAMATALVAPSGLWGLIAGRTAWSLFPLRRRLEAKAE